MAENDVILREGNLFFFDEKVRILKKDIDSLQDSGYVLLLRKNHNNITIKNHQDEPIVELIYCEDSDEILISSREKFEWCKGIKSIIAPYQGIIFIFYATDCYEGEIIVED